MLPVVAGVGETKTSILLYSVLLLALTLMFSATVASLHWIYLGSALALGVGFVGLAWRLKRRPEIEGARLFFHYSMLYLAALFLAIMIDSAL